MEHVSLSVFDYNDKKICDLYDSRMKAPGQAYSICLTTELSGWKEISFTLPYMIDRKSNFRWKYIRNEYKLRLRRGESEDWFVISRPKRSHSSGQISNTVTCYHSSTILKTKNLYQTFDDENGIDTCPNLIKKALAGSGWSLGVCDTLYERDGVTEKIRSLSSEGKVGAYQLVTDICTLFKAYPIFHGATKTVDIHALSNKQPQKEMIVGHNLTALSVDYDSDGIVTRLYIEGEYGDNGYVGIDDVNPTGLSYLFNFDYYKEIGLFTDEHQVALDHYYKDMGNAVSTVATSTAEILKKEDELNNLWGQPSFVYYKQGNVYYKPLGVAEEDVSINNGDNIYVLLNDGTYKVEEAPLSANDLAYDCIKFITPTSSSIGAKEVAISAKESLIKSYEEDSDGIDEAEQEQIDTLKAGIIELYIGTDEATGLYELMHQAAELVCSLKILYDDQHNAQSAQTTIEAAFVDAMGDFLKDGYWSNTNYITGQEEYQYQDALDMSKELGKPQVTYTITPVQVADIWGEIQGEYLLNSKVRIYDPDLQVNDIIFVTKLTETQDDHSKDTVEVSNDDLSIAGKSFSSVLSRISQLADLIDQKNSLYSRAESISQDGSIAIKKLNGTIDILKNKLLSSTSSWYTDDNGNIVFLSVNGKSAMMLSGEGFMIANGKTSDGEWNWRTFGTGEGFTADAIVTGYLSAARIETGSIGMSKLSEEVVGAIEKVGVLEEKVAEIDVSEEHIISTVLTSEQYVSDISSLQTTIDETSVHVDVEAPANPEPDALWLDISLSPSVLKCWNGTEWEIVNDTEALKSRVSYAESKITDSAIVDTVRSHSDYLADLSKTEQSAISQTTSAFEVRFTSVEEVANAANETASSLKSELSTWYSFGKDALEIGKSGSPFKTRQDNEKYEFLNNGTVVASMSGNVAIFPKANAESEFRIGGLKGVVDKSTGSINWIYVGFDGE